MSVQKKYISSLELKKKVLKELFLRYVLSFYKYFFIKNPTEFSNKIKKIFIKKNILGRIYISKEGINAQISIPWYFLKFIKLFIKNLDIKLNNINFQRELSNKKISFWKLIIKIRSQILSSKIKNFIFDRNRVGKYLNAEQVNQYIHKKNAILVDMRNHYEYYIGHFKNSITYPSQTFKIQLKNLHNFLKDYKKKNIILYCTGGIRCEKATSLLLYYNFKNVFQIFGGILGYIHEAKIKNLPIYFLGKLFVFDARLEEKVTSDIFTKCKNCKKITNNKYINCRNNFCHLLFIQCNSCSKKFNFFCSEKCKNI
ncbi:rhodanese-related sulfurtransferase [Buchnera aphidicola]|uniref:oxygen-dependent tRNA uridine(34) hydroxylase TrhO n=1 Tax=Buchnera aphidicola TaxID=9 RepID=UPI0031B6EDE3